MRNYSNHYRLFFFLAAMGTNPFLSANQVQQIDFHQLATANKNSWEIGKLSFYFAVDPAMITLTKKDNLYQFLFPALKMFSLEQKKKMDQINQQLKPYGAMVFESVSSPQTGLRMTITLHNPAVAFTIDRFDSIKQQPGIVIHFYDRSVIKKIEEKGAAMLTTACNGSVIIDCGHGGNDFGAVGITGLKEKDINLAIGRLVANELQKDNVNVVMTRDTDQPLSLANRTAYAANLSNSLFVSIHSNYAANKHSSGVETFYFDPMQVKTIFCSATPTAFLYEAEKYRSQQSRKCAQYLQQAVIGYAQQKNPSIIDRQVKKATSQVLLGSAIPAALIEIGFLSSPHEASLLADPSYQLLIAQGISCGIRDYLRANH